MNADEFRSAALAVRGAVESSHMDHPDFRLNGKIFASLGYPDADWGMVKLTPEQQRSFVKKSPEAFSPCAGAWGARGATGVRLESVRKGDLTAALKAASSNVSDSTAAGRKRRAPAGGTGARQRQ